MATKKKLPKTIIITEKFAKQLSLALSKYGDLLQMEIESSINDKEIIRDYKIELKQLDILELNFDEAIANGI